VQDWFPDEFPDFTAWLAFCPWGTRQDTANIRTHVQVSAERCIVDQNLIYKQYETDKGDG